VRSTDDYFGLGSIGGMVSFSSSAVATAAQCKLILEANTEPDLQALDLAFNVDFTQGLKAELIFKFWVFEVT